MGGENVDGCCPGGALRLAGCPEQGIFIPMNLWRQMPIAIGIFAGCGLIAVVDVLVHLRGPGIEASGISTEQLLSFLGAPILVCVAELWLLLQ